ncbi:MAG: hypothetical protein KA285_01545 [Bacteroidia bacterium]|nr:hypothetical protein [Bacteroidia bacterium]
MNNKLFDIKDLKGMKYYLLFVSVIIGLYIYSMTIGYRFLSFTESNHSQQRTGARTYFHK